MQQELTLHDIYLARQRIAGLVLRSPMVRSESLSRRWNCEAWLKLEDGISNLDGILAAPDTLDLSKETDATKKLYGIGEGKTDNFGRQCLLADAHDRGARGCRRHTRGRADGRGRGRQ